jgi:hypothetical protein
MIPMRSLVLCALLFPACAAPPATTLASKASDPGPAAIPATDGVYHPPYSMLFREGQSWTLPVAHVQLAMSSEPRPGNDVTCVVEHVDQFCDRRISNIKCEGEGSGILAGMYSATLDGLWKADEANGGTELDDHEMLISREPPFKHAIEKRDAAGNVVATIATKPWGAAWCIDEQGTASAQEICILPGKGLIGGRDHDLVIGTVPRVD